MKTTLVEYLLLLLVLLALFSVSIALEINLYPYLSFVTPFLWYITKQRQNVISFVLFVLTLVIIINMEYLLFVDYMNKPWFAGEDPFTCDGPCYGWYTYEHNIDLEIIINIALLVGSSFGMLLINTLHHKKKIS